LTLIERGWFRSSPAVAGRKIIFREGMEGSFMVDAKKLRTLSDKSGIAILEVVKEEDTVTIFEADDMDRQVRFPAALIPALIGCLEGFTS
jgi:hypothetical protein